MQTVKNILVLIAALIGAALLLFLMWLTLWLGADAGMPM